MCGPLEGGQGRIKQVEPWPAPALSRCPQTRLGERRLGGMTLGGKSCRLQPSASSGLLTPAPLTSRSGLGPWEIAARAWPPARGLQGAPGLTARPRTGLAARSRSASSSLGTAGDPRADAQTDRRRGAGRSPAAPGSANQRRGGRTPLTLLRSPGSPERGSHESAHVAPEPRGVLGSLPRALVRVYAPSLRFKQGTFTCSGTPKNCMQNRLFKCCFFFLSWCGGSPF